MLLASFLIFFVLTATTQRLILSYQIMSSDTFCHLTTMYNILTLGSWRGVVKGGKIFTVKQRRWVCKTICKIVPSEKLNYTYIRFCKFLSGGREIKRETHIPNWIVPFPGRLRPKGCVRWEGWTCSKFPYACRGTYSHHRFLSVEHLLELSLVWHWESLFDGWL